MKWTELDGPGRYRAIRMLIRNEVTLAELSRTFEVSRQTISRARERVEQAACEALEPKTPGRKGKSEEQRQIETLKQQEAQLRQQLAQEKKKVEIAQAFLDLERRMERGETQPGEGKKKNQDKRRRRARRRKKTAPRGPRLLGTAARVAGQDDGGTSGHEQAGAGALAEKETAD